MFGFDCDSDAYSLRNSWQCAISHVFNTTGESVNFICSMIDDMPLDLCILNRRIKFLQNLMWFHAGHLVLNAVSRHAGKHELFLLRTQFYRSCRS